MQLILQEELDQKHDYQGPFQTPGGRRRRRRRRRSRRRRRRRRGWFRKAVRKVGKFIKNNYKKILEFLKKYHKCCTEGSCAGEKYCYTEWFKKENDIGARRYENRQKELLLRALEDADYDVYDDEKK